VDAQFASVSLSSRAVNLDTLASAKFDVCEIHRSTGTFLDSSYTEKIWYGARWYVRACNTFKIPPEVAHHARRTHTVPLEPPPVSLADPQFWPRSLDSVHAMEDSIGHRRLSIAYRGRALRVHGTCVSAG
jgi:hypothetical protein